MGHSDKDAFAVKGETEQAGKMAEEVEQTGASGKLEERETQVDDYAPTFRC